MATNKSKERYPDDYHIVAFDPGGVTGWAWLRLSAKAFSAPARQRRLPVLPFVRDWDCGEFTGPEYDQLHEAVRLIHRAKFGPINDFNARTDVISEDFDLTQLIGGEELLSPVRMIAVLNWECQNRGFDLILQRRQLRTGVTRDRLKLWGFTGVHGKDEFAAMQHAVTHLRLVKKQANSAPWRV